MTDYAELTRRARESANETARYGDLLDDMASAVEKLQAVMQAADALCARIDVEGTITSHSPLVDDLMDALHEADPK